VRQRRELRLRSVVFNTIWPPEEELVAAHDLERAANYLYLYDDVRQPHLRSRAIGRVSLWGSVVEGEHGWRASHAYPERILLPSTDRAGRPTAAEAIAEGLACYGVPVEILDRIPTPSA
jgi:hypothetical protein